MSRHSKNHVPAYRLYKRTGQAVVTLGGKDHYLGRYQSNESKEAYNRLIADWFAAGKDVTRFTLSRQSADESGPTIDYLIAAFWLHAQAYYRDKDGNPTKEQASFIPVLRLLRRLYGSSAATRFGPLCLEACQNEMIREGLSRKTINRRAGRIRQVFKWGVSKEMIGVATYDALKTVMGLKRGRSAAKERRPVQPADCDVVIAVLKRANRFIAAMIELQLITGMRSGELVIMRTRDIDRSGAVWTYEPSKHKTEHHDHQRIIHLGKRAQEILTPFLSMIPDAYLFDPREAEAERRMAATAARSTPSSCGNVVGSNRKPRRSRPIGERYTVDSYGHATRRLCEAVFPAPEGLSPDDLTKWLAKHRFHPHQLRHTAATRFRRESDIETTRALLGQKTIQAAEIYAEQDMDRAKKFAMTAG